MKGRNNGSRICYEKTVSKTGGSKSVSKKTGFGFRVSKKPVLKPGLKRMVEKGGFFRAVFVSFLVEPRGSDGLGLWL